MSDDAVDEDDRERAAAERDDAPLSELAREVRERRERLEREEEAETEDDPFERVDVGDVDSEAVWEAVVEGGERADVERVGVGREPERVAAETDEGTETLVSKREYCQRCPHFTEPPEVACTHEGTEIVEVVDNDTFRVRNCPMITTGREPPKFE
ncbi:hypothetical protein [Salinirarus marinus]|uniref:hypothetical protein n=1 Tax=Salinirarus marinus TaxID=3068310 RepID=UPI003C6C13C1